MIPASVQALITRWRLGHIASLDAEGWPRVSPKGTFLVVDDRRLAFADIRSPGTLANIAADPRVEVNFVDTFLRKGARLKGRARLADPAETAGLMPRFREIWGDLCDRVTGLVLIDVTAVAPLTTPPYDDGVTEAEMIALYKAKFAEMYP